MSKKLNIKSLKWTNGPTRKFGAAARKALGLNEAAPVNVRGIMEGYIKREDIFTLAIQHALMHKDKEITIEDVDELLDDYHDKDGSDEALEELLIETYLQGHDPNGLISWKKSLAHSKKIQEAARKEAEMEMEIQDKKLEKSVEKAEAAVKKISGGTPPDSA